MLFGSGKRQLPEDVGGSEEEHGDAEAQREGERDRERLKLISPMTMMTMTLARVKEMMKKNEPSNMLVNLPNIPSLMR
jgi:hypothetical protein